MEPTMHRLHGKKEPIQEATFFYVEHLRRFLNTDQSRGKGVMMSKTSCTYIMNGVVR